MSCNEEETNLPYELKYRMYGLVPYNISPIQQAIQYGHAIVEYSLYHYDDEYRRWAMNDKTFIILNGGTTNHGGKSERGTLNVHLQTLVEAGVKLSTFQEPDLGDQLTAVVFLVDERVWDKVKYPDFTDGYYEIYGTPMNQSAYEIWLSLFSNKKEEVNQILFLREFLKQFRLA